MKGVVMSVMMSDMKTASKKAAKKARVRSQKPLRREFTVREMNRSGAELLEAARKLGRVTVKSRSGEVFEISVARPTPELVVPSMVERMRAHRQRMTALGNTCGPEVDVERLNKVIAGEL